MPRSAKRYELLNFGLQKLFIVHVVNEFCEPHTFIQILSLIKMLVNQKNSLLLA